jgi:hypothetical protein
MLAAKARNKVKVLMASRTRRRMGGGKQVVASCCTLALHIPHYSHFSQQLNASFGLPEGM